METKMRPHWKSLFFDSCNFSLRRQVFEISIVSPDSQAALCPLALDQARSRGVKGPFLTEARDVMVFVLLAVVLTAPLSAALTSRRGLANVLVRDRRASSATNASSAANVTTAGPDQPA